MQPFDQTRPTYDPVEIARSLDADLLARLLREQGSYVAPQRLLKVLMKSLRDAHPLMLEGDRGAGKTALSEALAESCNLPHFFFPCMDGVTVEEMLASFDSTIQSQFVMQQLASGVERETAQRAQWTLPFLNLGEIGAAYQMASLSRVRVVLTIDEVDKLDERRSDALLQVLARGFFDVPRLLPDSRIGSYARPGRPRLPLRPLVFLTSNNMRGGTSSPLRSRCYLTGVEYPSDLEQIAILRVRVPEAPAELVAQVLKLMTYTRMMDISEKPALREMIDLTQSLLGDCVTRISREVIEDNLCVFAKKINDQTAIMNRLSTLVEIVNQPEPELDALVARVYDIREAGNSAAYSNSLT